MEQEMKMRYRSHMAEDFIDALLEKYGVEKKFGGFPSRISAFDGNRLARFKAGDHVASYDNYDDAPSYDFVDERLYQTRTGAFVLVGWSQCCGPWARQGIDDSDTYPAYAIISADEADARAWLRLRGLHEAYERIFPESEVNPTPALHLSRAAFETAYSRAQLEAVTVLEFIENLVQTSA